MVNELIAARDRFCVSHPEQRRLVNGRDWGVVRAGKQGPALILLPGTLGRADIFWNQIEALEANAQILALSYPQDGTITDWADDIAAMMAAEGMEAATILGSSLGGYVAQYFVGVFPEKSDGLVAANTLPEVSFLKDVAPYKLDVMSHPAQSLMNGFLDGLKQWMIDEPARSDLVDLLIQEVEGRIPIQELRNRLAALKYGPDLPDISLDKSRVFTVESDDDRLIPAPLRAAVRARLNPVTAKHFKHGSHFPYVTHPDEYTAMIGGILGLKTAASTL